MDINTIKERRLGHPEIWECTVEQFIEKAMPELNAQYKKNNLQLKEVKLAASFLRIKFDKKELKGTIEYEVANAIQEAMIYYTNCKGE